MAEIGAVVFDFDGVLANSEPLHLQSYQAALGEIGVTLGRDEYYQQYLGFDDATVFRTLSERRGLGWTAQEISGIIARKTVIFDEIVASTDVLFPEAVACVERLAAALPLGIASGALRHEIEAILRRSGLDQHFRFIVAAGETARGKPAPDPYRRAARLHERSPEQCVAIEDSRWGIESAKDAGLHCVGITTSYPARDLPGADAIIASLDEFTVDLLTRL
jgi:beta-phosphoglucomutase-like phosphatase (HAD superfamily)